MGNLTIKGVRKKKSFSESISKIDLQSAKSDSQCQKIGELLFQSDLQLLKK